MDDDIEVLNEGDMSQLFVVSDDSLDISSARVSAGDLITLKCDDKDLKNGDVHELV